MSKSSAALNMNTYSAGEKVHRPWGDYEVIDVGVDENGKEYCEKFITVNPGQILSLQSHEMRREIWTVQEGTLEVIVNSMHYTITKGKSIQVPLRAIHCMANNINNEPCIVHECQVGICREEDIIRYIDAYGRQTQNQNMKIQVSIELYIKLRSQIRNE